MLSFGETAPGQPISCRHLQRRTCSTLRPDASLTAGLTCAAQSCSRPCALAGDNSPCYCQSRYYSWQSNTALAARTAVDGTAEVCTSSLLLSKYTLRYRSLRRVVRPIDAQEILRGTISTAIVCSQSLAVTQVRSRQPNSPNDTVQTTQSVGHHSENSGSGQASQQWHCIASALYLIETRTRTLQRTFRISKPCDRQLSS